MLISCDELITKPPDAVCDTGSTSKKVKVAHTRLPSVGFWSWSRFLVVSLQVTWVINPAVGCRYFPPGLQLPPQPLRGCYQFCCLVNRGTMGVNSLPKTVTWQRRGYDLNLGPSAPEPPCSTGSIAQIVAEKSHSLVVFAWKELLCVFDVRC